MSRNVTSRGHTYRDGCSCHCDNSGPVPEVFSPEWRGCCSRHPPATRTTDCFFSLRIRSRSLRVNFIRSYLEVAFFVCVHSRCVIPYGRAWHFDNVCTRNFECATVSIDWKVLPEFKKHTRLFLKLRVFRFRSCCFRVNICLIMIRGRKLGFIDLYWEAIGYWKITMAFRDCFPLFCSLEL